MTGFEKVMLLLSRHEEVGRSICGCSRGANDTGEHACPPPRRNSANPAIPCHLTSLRAWLRGRPETGHVPSTNRDGRIHPDSELIEVPLPGRRLTKTAIS